MKDLAPLALLVLPAAAASLASPAAAQTNDVPLNNGGERLTVYSSPSVPGSLTSPPTGDLFWKVLPGDRVMHHRTDLGAAVEIDGYQELLFDTDWTTSPAFYDRAHGPATRNALGVLEPAFFTSGLTSETVVVIGKSGFGHPCTIAPSLCSPSGGACPPPAFPLGYAVELVFAPGSGIVLPADGTAASHLATTYLVPGGMTATGGLCGKGDYALQDERSIDETMLGVAGGLNPYGGHVLDGARHTEPASETTTMQVSFRHPMLNVRADSGAGEETSESGGGATNALRLSVGGGQSALNVEIRSLQHAGVPNVAVVGASPTGLVGAGIDVLGATLLVLPTGLFSSTLQHWTGSVVATTFFFTVEGAYAGTPIPVPATLAGVDAYLQGAILDLGTGLLENTNAWRTSLLP